MTDRARLGKAVMRPFFMEAPGRSLFCVYHAPAGEARAHASVLYVPPFAEEMPKARRMAALQARRLAQRGVGVLMLDLTGSGDSSGDFADARWDLWLEDVRLGLGWLRREVPGPTLLWGLRLGALLALEAAQTCRDAVRAVVMWQPITSGEQYLTHLLRIKVAGEMAQGRRMSVQDLRQAASAGQSVEIGGYEVDAKLAAAIDDRMLSVFAVRGLAAGWFELVSEPGSPVSSGSQRVVQALVQAGMTVHSESVVGPSFWDWNLSDITECGDLLARTDAYVDTILGAS